MVELRSCRIGKAPWGGGVMHAALWEPPVFALYSSPFSGFGYALSSRCSIDNLTTAVLRQVVASGFRVGRQ